MIRDARVADLRLGAHNALRECRRAAQESLRNLFGREPADLAQRKRDLGIRRQRGMAAREHKSQPIVFDALVLAGQRRIIDHGFDLLGDIVDRVESRAPA